MKHDHKEWKIYEDESMHAVVQSDRRCGACPEDKCLGAIPHGNEFGAQCIRDINPEDVYKKVVSMISQ